ncbi:FecR family protein [Cerasicoccus arenae]|uniref:FecR protein domain-containing protein n=1 Tax=Cerasicoccus arenae TaxID=424488 RepID=A0A8J3DF85_9BACT|nr:FecR domain-containing protein [Cerasicoccus arenae]MBK1857031.1 FecR domain-containing protein [Cerasicoccus arenae]GHB91960.1 hypothetical protein GCM10007047_03630 [Cerasicoccus arenae]
MKTITHFLLWLALASALSAGTVEKAIVQVYLVKGDVTLIELATGETQPLQRGDLIGEGYAIETQVNSSALLLFSNGSSINVTPETYLNIAEFSQQPYEMSVRNYALLGQDPSPSNTTLELHYGKVVGNVRKLTPQSKYVINSPTGSAGIRGTTFVYATITKSEAVQASQGNLQSTVTSLSVGEGVVELVVDGVTYTVPAGESKVIEISFEDGTVGELRIRVAEELPETDLLEADAILLRKLDDELLEAQNNQFLISPGGDQGDLVLTPLRTQDDPTNLDNVGQSTNFTNSPF